MRQPRVFLSLGSNLGDREGFLRRGLETLEAEGFRSSRFSSLYETDPWGGVEQAPFLNLVAEGTTDLGPHDLLLLAKRTEARLGRSPGPRWGPRELDIDILLYGDTVLETFDLILPHPRIPERRFVLVPLAELAPALCHPVLGLSVAELLERTPDRGAVRRIGPWDSRRRSLDIRQRS